MITNYLQTLRRFSRDLRIFLVTAVLVGVAWDGLRAVLFNLCLLRLGYGPESIGLIDAVGGLAFALMCLPAGVLGTRYGIRSMLITGLGLLCSAFFLLPLVEWLTAAWRMLWLLATTVMAYFGCALYLVNGLPFVLEAAGRSPPSSTSPWTMGWELRPLSPVHWPPLANCWQHQRCCSLPF